jgi:hypothetical protein
MNKKPMFDFVIGNPPYQENIDNRGEQPPVYHHFYNAAEQLSDKSMLITPARFLFDAGKTPSDWNQKMLSNEHFKVLNYIPASKDVFAGADIKGGVAIGYIDKTQNFGAIDVFIPDETIRTAIEKVKAIMVDSLASILSSNTSYKYDAKFFDENPGIESRVSGGSKRYLSSSVFDKFPEFFYEEKPDDEHKYAYILGRKNSRRTWLYFREDYLVPPENYNKYKVFVPSSNGSGTFGEVMTTPVMGTPVMGHAETFISLGCFDTEQEAANLMIYLKTKFARFALGTKKVTQGNKTPKVWSNVPLQDFTENSDIDWSKSVADIDKQLYTKYGLSQDEIDFIESHVKEME